MLLQLMKDKHHKVLSRDRIIIIHLQSYEMKIKQEYIIINSKKKMGNQILFFFLPGTKCKDQDL